MTVGAWQDFDLLHRRRLELGIETLTPASTQGLLWRGFLIGIALFGSGSLGWAGLLTWARMLEGRQQALQPVAAQHQQFETRLGEVRQQLDQLGKSNQALADAILAIPSGALLLADLATMTPLAIQLTAAKQEGSKLSLTGLAVQPDGLRAINALQLALENLALPAPDQVQLVKVQEQQVQPAQPGGAQPSPPQLLPQVLLSFEIKAALAQAGTKANLPRLQAVGGSGLLSRLQVLQAEGLLR